MEKDLERSGVGREDDEVSESSGESLGGFVGSLLHLLVMGSLLNELKDLVAESSIGQWVGFRIHFFGHLTTMPRADRHAVPVSATEVSDHLRLALGLNRGNCCGMKEFSIKILFTL